MRGSAVRCGIFAAALFLAARSARGQTVANPAGGNAPPATAPSPFQSSVPSAPVSGVLPLSLQDAIDRGLKQNLGLLLSGEDVRSARGERWKELSALLPNVTAMPYAADSRIDLAELGFTFKFPGVTIPSVVGPFAYLD